MPGWMIAVLKWGGLALAVVNLLAIIALDAGAPPHVAQEAGAAGGSVGMMLFGIVAAAIGFMADRRSRH